MFHVKHNRTSMDTPPPLIILDRDGVINFDSDHYIRTLAEFQPLPGSLEAMARLKQAGYQIAIATNQSGIARGYYEVATLEAMHAQLQQWLAPLNGAVDLICYCPHAPEDHCRCRKPQPALFEQIAAHYHRPHLHGVYSVGDSWRDAVAALAVGAVPIQVRTGKGERTLAQHAAELAAHQIPIVADLAAAVDYLLLHSTSGALNHATP